MDIYQNNIRLLKAKFPQMYDLYRAYEGERQESVYVESDFAAVVTDREWYFTSRYDAKEAAKIWASQFEPKQGQLYIMAGLGNGIYAEALKKHLPDSCGLLIYEPCTEIFLQALEKVDLSKLLRGRTAIVAEDINKGHLYEYFMQTINYGNRNDIHFCIHPNYDRVYPKQVDWLHGIIQNEISMLEVVKNTELMYSKEFFKNMMTNLWSYMSNSSLEQLKIAMEPVKNKNIPAVIVAAGPSLNKNITQLKAYKNRVFMIACDSALNPLLQNGIIPDLAVSLDSHKPLQYFSQPEVADIPFVLCLQAVEWFQESHRGRKFYFADNNLTINIMHQYGKEPGVLETSGSVANNAFSVAQVLGFTKIILIGQDLAYEDGIYYAKGVHSNNRIFSIQSEAKPKNHFEVEGYYGGTVVTNDSLNFYRTWFEKQMIRYPQLHVINATEGGAMIHGAQNVPLAQALENECGQEMDFAEMINRAAQTFTCEELDKVRSDFYGFKDTLEDIKKDIAEGVRNYRKMEELVRKGKQGNSEFNRLLARIHQIQGRIDTEPLMDLAAMHNRETEYAVLDSGGKNSGDAYHDTINALHDGVRILESYSTGIDFVIQDLPVIYEHMN